MSNDAYSNGWESKPVLPVDCQECLHAPGDININASWPLKIVIMCNANHVVRWCSSISGLHVSRGQVWHPGTCEKLLSCNLQVRYVVTGKGDIRSLAICPTPPVTTEAGFLAAVLADGSIRIWSLSAKGPVLQKTFGRGTAPQVGGILRLHKAYLLSPHLLACVCILSCRLMKMHAFKLAPAWMGR